MRLHEANWIYEVGKILKNYFGEDRIIFEGAVGERKRIDIVLDNYQLLVEVEPSEERVYSKDSGLNQLEKYAKEILTITNHSEIYGIVAYKKQQELKFIPVIYKRDGSPIIEKTLGIQDFTIYLANLKNIISSKKLELNPLTFNYVFDLVFCKYLDEVEKIIKGKRKQRNFEVLYNAYANALKIIYGKDKIGEDKLIKLFSTHTLLQTIAIAILSELYGIDDRGIRFISTEGKPFAVGLPFLDWFNRINLEEEEKKIFEELSDFIKYQVRRFDYLSDNSVDIFRLLYEQFIEREDRKTFGEYYTPLYLVNIVLDLIGRDKIKDHIILDPFCGSGTFLYACFKEKVDSGKDPKTAISELVGFDINPLAVSLARAELLIAYLRELKQRNQTPENIIPAIYYLNSADVFSYHQGVLFPSIKKGKKDLETVPIVLYEVQDIIHLVNMAEASKLKDLLSLQEIEYDLKGLIMNIFEKEKREKIEEKKKMFIYKYGKVINLERLESFIENYGNGVWTVSIVSLIARNIVFNSLKERVVIVSNPPWKSLGEVSGMYGKALKKIVSVRDLNKYKNKKLVEVINRGDISSLFLNGFQDLKPVDIAFIMPETVAYDRRLSGIGKILTYNALNGKADIYRILYDVFEHGIWPAVVKKGESCIYEIKLISERKIDKSMEKVDYKIEKKDLDFKTYVDDIYFVFGVSNKDIVNALKIKRFLCGWSSITGLRGLFSEEDKAGLFICEIRRGCPTTIKLHGLDCYFDIQDININLEKDIKSLVYYSLVFPFAIFPIKILMPDKISKLEDLLLKIEEKLRDENEKRVIRNLKNEVEKIKQAPVISKSDMWYVVYKNRRIFWSGVVRGSFLFHQSCSFLECNDALSAYYYAGIFNWLAQKVETGYLRDNMRRPVCSLLKLNLQYTAEEWQKNIANLGMEIEKKAKEIFEKDFEDWKKVKCKNNKITIKSKKALEWLSSLKEWHEIEKMLNEKITPSNLNKALKYVKELRM